MQRLITLVSSIAAVALLAVGCGSDSVGNNNTGGAAGASGSGASGSGAAGSGGSGGGSDSQCVGTYSDLTLSEFTAKSTSGGKCADAVDLGSVCSNDLTKITGTCGIACLTSAGTDDATQNKCVASCLGSKVKPALGADCRDCYVADVQCARTFCRVDCLSPTSATCATCRSDKGCAGEFYSCTGLAVPGSSNGGSGSGGGPAGSAGESNGGTGGA